MFFYARKITGRVVRVHLKHISSYNIPVIKLSKPTSKGSNAGLQGIATYYYCVLLP